MAQGFQILILNSKTILQNDLTLRSSMYCFIYEILTYTAVGVKKYDFRLEFAKVIYTTLFLDHSYITSKIYDKYTL